MSDPVRLQRYLAAGGVAARRKAEDLITEGRVKVNGKIIRELGTKIIPDRDRVEVDGEAVVALDKFYVLLNKPKACITAVTDDRGRPTVMDYLPNLPIPVKPVGRLDFYTEGVLLLTNDGELAARLLAPASHVPKTYHVKVHGELRKDELLRLREGVRLDDGTMTMPAEVAPLPGESKHTWLAITIHEGKHRQIHRMIESLGHTVDKLQRVAFGNLSYHNLRVGDARELDQQELNQLRDLVGLDHSATARGRWSTQREATDIPRRARAKARAEAEADQQGIAGGPPRAVEPARDPRAGRADGSRGAAGTRGNRAPAPRGGQGRTFGKRDKRAPAADARPERPASRPYVARTPSPDARPSDARPGARPSNVRPGARPSNARPSNARPSNARPSNARPSNARPSNARPAGARPSNARPAAARPAHGRPSNARPGRPAGRSTGRPGRAPSRGSRR